MILAAVDDLLFRSKIRTTAKQLDVDIYFARSADEVVQQARQHRPALVVMDLNSTVLNPLATITTLKADPALASTRILGFVSHVQTDLIAAARNAGADEVLARSAFAAGLDRILSSAGRSEP